MSRRTRVLVALYGTAAVLAAPWAIDYALRRWCGFPWHQPSIPVIRLDTPRRHT